MFNFFNKKKENNENYNINNFKGEEDMPINQNKLRPTHYGRNTYFSAANPNCSLRLDIWNDNMCLVFTNRISNDNREELKAYINGLNLSALAQVLKATVRFRQEEWIAEKAHNASFTIPIHLTKYDSQNQKVIPNGTLFIKTVEDNKVAIEFTKDNKTITVVLFSERVATDQFKDVADVSLLNHLDLRDTALINFANEVEGMYKLKMPMYALLVDMFEFFIGPKVKDNNANYGQKAINDGGGMDDFADASNFTEVSDF